MNTYVVFGLFICTRHVQVCNKLLEKETKIIVDNNASRSWVVVDNIVYAFLDSCQNLFGSTYENSINYCT